MAAAGEISCPSAGKSLSATGEVLMSADIRQSRRDCLVAIGGGVLVDERGARAGMTHPRHELSGARTGGCGKGVAGMAEIMKMEMSQAGRVASPVP